MDYEKIINELEDECLLYIDDLSQKISQDEKINYEEVLYRLSYIVEFRMNYEQYTSFVKDNVYNILSAIRFRTNDTLIKEEINRLITILNKTGTYNAEKYLRGQYLNRFGDFYERNICYNMENSIPLQQFLHGYAKKDLSFAKSLFLDSEENFKDKYYDDIYSIFNFSYLFSCYQYMLKDESLRTKILNYLNHIKNKLMTTNIEPHSTFFLYETFNRNTKKLIDYLISSIQKNKLYMTLGLQNKIFIEVMTEHLLFVDGACSNLENTDNGTLVKIFDCFERFIYKHPNIYSDNLKNTIYEICGHYLKVIDNPNIVKRVKTIIDRISTSNDENLKEFYEKQYALRYAYMPDDILPSDFEELEEVICSSMCYDLGFLNDLYFCDINSFITNDICNVSLFSNICYFKSKYPELFACKDIKIKVNKLLDINNKASKKSIRKNIEREYFEDLKNRNLSIQKILKRN